MRTETANKILTHIKEKDEISPHLLADYLEISHQAVHRQLKKLLSQNLIFKAGRPPKVTYSLKPMIIQNATIWASSNNAPHIPPNDIYCQTRDVFTGRADRLLADLQRHTQNDNLSFLLSSVVGEIGNNSFDHNLGNWRDIPGLYFTTDLSAHIMVLSDRGQGISATLKKIKPQIKDDEEALTTAFYEHLSGRAPEQRGNGLKFVKKIITENNWELEFRSGMALCVIKNNITNITKSNINIPGTLAIIKF